MMRRRRKGKVIKILLWIFGVFGSITAALALIQIDDIVMAQGIAEPGDKIYINSPMGRVIQDILVEPGDTVKIGQAVAKLYSGDLRAAVATAEQEINRERANLEVARASLQLLLEKPTPEEMSIATSRVEQAEITVKARQQDLGRIQVGRRLYSQEDQEQAQTNFDLSLATLKVTLENLNLVKRGPSPAEIEQAEATVRQTQASLDKTIHNLEATTEALESATMKSPVDGMVARQDLYPGMQANQGAIIMIIAGADKGTVISAWMPETSAWKVRQGQTVEILSNLFTDREGFIGIGQVGEVYGYATHEGGMRTFGLDVEVRQTPIPLTYGSTADLRIYVGRRSILKTIFGWENYDVVQFTQNGRTDPLEASQTPDTVHTPPIDSLATLPSQIDTLTP